jgi:hypothetical protein
MLTISWCALVGQGLIQYGWFLYKGSYSHMSLLPALLHGVRMGGVGLGFFAHVSKLQSDKICWLACFGKSEQLRNHCDIKAQTNICPPESTRTKEPPKCLSKAYLVHRHWQAPCSKGLAGALRFFKPLVGRSCSKIPTPGSKRKGHIFDKFIQIGVYKKTKGYRWLFF